MEATASAKSRLPELAKYEVVEEIGHGGMATVYRARDRRLHREVAVKVIHKHLRDSREVVARFNTEARAVAKLKHPNIVEVFDVSEEGEDEQYLVVELIRGTTLRKVLQKHGPMPPEVAAALGLELLAAIAHAHEAGVVHRDVKPENVLVEGGERAIVKLTDFGIAKLLDAQGVTSTGQVLGSPAHMAPEQIEGGDVDARSDVFGMGVLLYECMVGHLPFEGNNPAQVLRRVLDGTYPNAAAERPVVGARWSAVLDRALAHAPAERYADASAMRAAIEEELARLNVGDAPQLLASWLDDPAGSEERHRKAMIDRLVALADVARKARDPLSAAGDYNRALAHAPDDPNLLRIVAGLHRAEARARLVKQAAVVTMLMVGLGVVAFAVGRTFRHAPAPPIVADTAVAPPPSVPLPVISSAPSAVASVAPRPTSVPVLRISPVPSAKPVERTMVLELQPPMGLKVAIDDQPAKNVQSGDSVVLDGKAHVLTFGCSVCVAVPRTVAPGDKDDTIAVHVSLKPANLTIVGDGNMTYEIVEHPMAVVRVGANSVLLPSEFEPVTVKQIESGATVTVRLHAGHAVEADFP